MTRLRMILAASLVLNIFLAGGLIGGGLWLTHGRGMILAGSFRIAGSELPAASQGEIRAAMREVRRSMRPQIEDAREARRQAAELLRQPSVDQQAIIATLEKARTADFSLRTALEQHAIAVIATLPLADRNLLADGIDERSRRRSPAAR